METGQRKLVFLGDHPPAPSSEFRANKIKAKTNKKTKAFAKHFSVENQVAWLFGVQIPALQSEINEKNREINSLKEENKRLISEVQSSKESLQFQFDLRISELQSEITEKHGENNSLKEENKRLNSVVQLLNESLQSLKSSVLKIDNQWPRIAEEMTKIHNEEQYVYSD